MTIRSFRFYYYPSSERFGRYLTATHWGFADWFKRRLKLVREDLRGPEAEGVDIINIMFHETPGHAWRPDEWAQRVNTFEFSFVCDLSPLRDQPPIENIERLMVFAAAMAAQAPWPQVRAVGAALSQPLSSEDRLTLAPYLNWPRESVFRALHYDGDYLEAAMRKAKCETRDLYKEARYLDARSGSAIARSGRKIAG